MSFLAYLVARLREPSTYAGLAALLGFSGIHLAPEALSGIITFITSGAALIAILVPDLNKPSA